MVAAHRVFEFVELRLPRPGPVGDDEPHVAGQRQPAQPVEARAVQLMGVVDQHGHVRGGRDLDGHRACPDDADPGRQVRLTKRRQQCALPISARSGDAHGEGSRRVGTDRFVQRLRRHQPRQRDLCAVVPRVEASRCLVHPDCPRRGCGVVVTTAGVVATGAVVGGGFVVVGGGGGGVVVGRGGLDQVLVQVYVVVQLGCGALVGTAGAGLCGAARGAVRTGPLDLPLFELLSLLAPALGAGLAAPGAEASAAGTPGAGTPGAAGVLDVDVPAFAGGTGPVREVRNGIDATPATVNTARAPARTTCFARRDLIRRHWNSAGSTSSGSAVRDGRWGASAGGNAGTSDPAASAEVSVTAPPSTASYVSSPSTGASGLSTLEISVGSAHRAAPRAMAALGSASMATGRL